LGRVFDPTKITGLSWLKEFAQAPATLIFDTFVRVYFACRPIRDANGQYVSYTGYVDLERDNLLKILRFSDKPILTLGKRGTFDEFGTYPTSVIRQGKKVIAYYGGWTRCETVPFTVAIGRAESTDNGKTFKKIGKGGPVLSFDVDEPFIISGPKIRRFDNLWYLFYIAGKKWVLDNGKPEPVYRIRLALSEDGLHWKKHGKDIIETRLEKYEAQASPDVLFYKGKYHMFFCYRYSIDYRGKRGYRVGYASSNNLTDWIRDDSRAGIDISENGWDDESTAYPHVFELDSAVYMMYLGNQVGRFGFGLAQLENYTA